MVNNAQFTELSYSPPKKNRCSQKNDNSVKRQKELLAPVMCGILPSCRVFFMSAFFTGNPIQIMICFFV